MKLFRFVRVTEKLPSANPASQPVAFYITVRLVIT